MPYDDDSLSVSASGSDTVIWHEDVNGFSLFVTKNTDGTFYSYMAVPGTQWDARRSKEGLLSENNAKARCFGMMALRLEIWMLEAQTKAREHRNS